MLGICPFICHGESSHQNNPLFKHFVIISTKGNHVDAKALVEKGDWKPLQIVIVFTGMLWRPIRVT